MPVSYAAIPVLDPAAQLKRHGLRPDKRLGQNFLFDPQSLEKITRSAGIEPSDTVLEIGPGLGNLTRYLSVSGRKVVAVELDAGLLPLLRSLLKPYPNVEVVHGDILLLSPADLIDQSGYLVVANIPYYITSAIIRHLLENVPKPRRIVLTVQKEVAQRICARPGDLSLLALSVQVYGRPEVVEIIPASAFYPSPKIDSAVLSIEIYNEALIPAQYIPDFFKLVRVGYAQKRKKLRNSIAAGLHITPAEADAFLLRAEIDPQRRAETVSIPEWERLARIAPDS
jgi:16S rRNA (adenine1518-N6/adenine1519-N6)-dimethyltransferase